MGYLAVKRVLAKVALKKQPEGDSMSRKLSNSIDAHLSGPRHHKCVGPSGWHA